MPVIQINQCTRAQEDGLRSLGRTLVVVLNTSSNREIFVFFLTLVKYFHHKKRMFSIDLWWILFIKFNCSYRKRMLI